MDIKMLALDLDGALLRSDKSISEYSHEVLAKCRNLGIKVVVVTARPMPTICEVLCQEDFDAIISDGGATAIVGRKKIFEEIIEPKTANALVADFLTAGIIFSAEGGEHYFHNSNDESGYAAFRQSKGHHAVKTDFSSGIDVCIYKMNPRITPNDARKILAAYPELDFVEYTGFPFVRVAHNHSTKWQGVRRVAEYFEINTASVAAFGDDFIDIEMLANVGFGVAMGNAIPEAKAAARFVCGNNDEDGIAKWLEENILNNHRRGEHCPPKTGRDELK